MPSYAWEHANDIRTTYLIQRRAKFLAAYQSGMSKRDAAKHAGISYRSATRYLDFRYDRFEWGMQYASATSS